MKTLIFYICTLVLVFSVHSRKLGSLSDDYHTCLTENDVSDDDMFSVQDIIHDRHKMPENEERMRKNGCVLQCVEQKSGSMDGADYHVETIHSDLVKRSRLLTHAPPEERMVHAMDNCINETKDLTEKCGKAFALIECFVKAEDKINSEGHEHESKK